MAKLKLPAGSVAAELDRILDSPEIQACITELEATRWTGRPGYPIRAKLGMTLVKHLYRIPFWSRTIALVEEHDGLRAALGCTGTGEPDGVPSEDALRRFRGKLMDQQALLTDCGDQILASLKERHPEMGEHIAIDGSFLLAYSNGQKTAFDGGRERNPEEFSDQDASWGHRPASSTTGPGGGFGYKLHAVMCTATELPIDWKVSTGKAYEPRFAPDLLDGARRRGFAASTCSMDKGYDYEAVYKGFEDRNCRPIIPPRMTTGIKNGRHLPHECQHGTWVFAGTDYKRKAAKWRCPTGECDVSSRWVPASRYHTLIPRTTKRWASIYTKRWAIERGFGRLKNDYGLAPLRVRGLERVRLHGELAIITMLASALARARAE